LGVGIYLFCLLLGALVTMFTSYSGKSKGSLLTIVPPVLGTAPVPGAHIRAPTQGWAKRHAKSKSAKSTKSKKEALAPGVLRLRGQKGKYHAGRSAMTLSFRISHEYGDGVAGIIVSQMIDSETPC
jgi:hypothetical protein